MSTILDRNKFLGLFTRFPITKNLPNTAEIAWNVKLNGYGITPVRGIELFGQEATADDEKILDAYTFILIDGTQIPVRVRQTANDNKLEWYDADAEQWVILKSGLTKGSETTFIDYNTSFVSALYFGNGVENHSTWTGNTCHLTQALTGGEVSVKVDNNSAFPATGTIIYNGTEIAYSAKPDAQTFTVAAAHASSGADDGVAEAVDATTLAGVALSKIIVSLANRVYLVNEDDPNRVEYSKEGDATDWTAGANRADAGIEDFPVVGGRITGLSRINENLVIFKERTIILFEWQYPTSTTKTPNYKEILVADDIGAINHKGIANIYQETYFVSRNGVRSLSRVLSTESFDARPITDSIANTIKDYDFADAKSIYYEKEDVFLVTCKSDSDQVNNNRVIAIWHYTDPETGQRVRDFSILDMTLDCFFVYYGELYGGSSMSGDTYKIFEGKTRLGTAIRSVYTDNRSDFGEKNLKTAAGYLVEGLISEGCEIEYTFFFDGGRNGSQTFTIKADADYVSSKKINTMGAFKLGEDIIGGTFKTLESMKPFRCVIELQDVNFIDIQIQRQCTVAGSDYLIYYEGLVDPMITNELTTDPE